MFRAFAFRGEALPAIEPVHAAVERLVGATEDRRHQIRVVEVRQGGVGTGCAAVEDGLRQRFEPGRVGVSGRGREGVVDQADGVAVVALEPSSDVA